jgi:hypothetical protein
MSEDNGRAGILAARQDSPRRNVGIFQQFECHKAVIIRGFRILQNLGKLLQVPGAQ